VMRGRHRRGVADSQPMAVRLHTPQAETGSVNRPHLGPPPLDDADVLDEAIDRQHDQRLGRSPSLPSTPLHTSEDAVPPRLVVLPIARPPADTEARTESDRIEDSTVASRAASSAFLLLTRRVLVVIVSAVSTALVARHIGSGGFGIFASSQTFALLLAGIADFGFSIVLSRELASSMTGRQGILGAAVWTATTSSVLATIIMVAAGIATGPTSRHAITLFILAPTLLFTGVGTYRQVYLVMYHVGILAVIDIVTNVLQSVLIVAFALSGLGLYGIAAATTATGILNSLLVWHRGRRFITSTRPRMSDVHEFVRAAVPLGFASFLSSIYFTIDLVLLGWLVSKPQVGQYAAAIKFLSLLVQIPGFVALAVMPGLSSLRNDLEGRSQLAARMWHWLLVFGLPTCILAIIFAAPITHLAFGDRYDQSIPMFRILSAAAVVAFVSNVFGVVLNSLAVARWQVIQNVIAVGFNITLNVLLAPRYGPRASAWLTLATEVLVASGSLIALWHRLDFRPAMRVSLRPVVACAVMGAIGLVLQRGPAAAVPASIVGFVVVLVALKAWPEEFRFPRVGLFARDS
jgi:O-antigen/teichoic acid export membrane protein